MNTTEFIKILEKENIPHTIKDGWVCIKGGYAPLNSLTKLPDNVKFENSGCVYLNSLTKLPENVKFENGGGIYLSSLTKLPDNIEFENRGYVYLDSLTSPFQIHRGQQIELRNIDGFTVLINSKRAIGEYEIYSAKYFGGGAIDNLRQCYVVKSGEFYAHGSTVKEAIEDLNFKLAKQAGKKDAIARVKHSQRVTVQDFRIVTGACREGIRQHLSSCNIDIDTVESMPLSDALWAMSGTSYGEIFKEELEENVE